MMKLRTLVTKVLRDPIWQSLGVILGLITLIIPIFLNFALRQENDEQAAEPRKSKLIVHQLSEEYFLPNYLEQLGSRANLLINGKEENFVTVHKFEIGNQSDHPIQIKDFSAPLQVLIKITIHTEILL
jgi:hypothetical protein